MSEVSTATDWSAGSKEKEAARVSERLSGQALTIGTGFEARSFRARDVGELMDPLVMVDHYVMTQPTFGAHPHAGMSAVSLLFEDSEGLFHNRDSLGNDLDLQPGDLYWLNAGSGAVHDESPRVNARIHGLQVFVNVPQTRRFEPPSALLVRSEDMPVIENADYRVKVALGESNGVNGAVSPSGPMTILDGAIRSGRRFTHESAANSGLWVHAVDGHVNVCIGGTQTHLAAGQAVAMKTDGGETIGIANPSPEPVHFALFEGARIAEAYVQDGPFVMGSQDQIEDIKAAFKAGRLGGIANDIQTDSSSFRDE